MVVKSQRIAQHEADLKEVLGKLCVKTFAKHTNCHCRLHIYKRVPLHRDFDVAPCGACRPWIFFINGVLCFLKINGSEMEKEKS